MNPADNTTTGLDYRLSLCRVPSLAFVARSLSTWWIVLAGIIGLALALRVIGLDRKSVWFDEALGVEAAQLPLGELWGSVGSERNPPFYFLLQHYWLLAKPPGDGWLRLPAALAGTGAVAVSLAFAHDVLRRGWAAVAGLLIATSPFAIDMSQEARPYGLFFLCAASSILCLSRALGRRGKWWWWVVGYILSTALTLYTHNYAVFLLLAEATYLLIWMLVKRRLELVPLASLSVAGLVFVPWLAHLAGQVKLVSTGFWIDAPGPSTFWDTYQAFLVYTPIDHGAGTNTFLKVHRWIGLGLIGMAVAFLHRNSHAVLAGLALSIPVATAIAVSLVLPIYVVRYVSFAIGPFWIVLVYGLSLMPGRHVRLALGCVVALGVLANIPGLYTDPFYSRADLPGAASVIRANWQPGDLIAHTTEFSAVTFDYYNAGQEPQVLLSEEDRTAICSASAGYIRLWIVQPFGLSDPVEGTATRAALAEYAAGYPVVQELEELGVEILLVQVPGTAPCT
jgi:mannosyltransferase